MIFGELEVLTQVSPNRFECMCHGCGRTVIRNKAPLFNGEYKDCGCSKRKNRSGWADFYDIDRVNIDRIEQLRLAYDYSGRELSELMGKSISYYSEKSLKKSRFSKWDIEFLADLFHTDEEELLK